MINSRTSHPAHYEESYWKLVRNAAKCGVCGEFIESKTRHDFKTCSCGNVSVDGGLSYVRRAFKTNNFEEHCVWQRLTENEINATIAMYKDRVAMHSDSSIWENYILAGKRLLKEWYGKELA